MEGKFAYCGSANALAYGSGGSVNASFLCSTPEKALRLVEFFGTPINDDRPDWDKVDIHKGDKK